MMKKSSSKSGGKIFTTDEFSGRGQRFNRLVDDFDDPDADPEYDNNNNSPNSLPNDTYNLNHNNYPLPSSPTENDSSFSSSSPLCRSPWAHHAMPNVAPPNDNFSNVLMGSLVREEGHIYSLAASGDLLFTGSDSKNIRVWKNQKEFSGFKSNSGLVKAIVISNDMIFSGHQDGKIRVWRVSSKSATCYKRVGTLPTLRNFIKCSIKPSNYVEVRRHHSVLWIKHFDAISCLSPSEDGSLLYSASWDKTFKVWKVKSFKCLESVKAHDDAVNALVSGFDGLVFTGSADGTVKVWRREFQGKGTKHFFSQTLLKQECAVTALALSPEGAFVYCGSSDGSVNFWEREKLSSHGRVLRGHKLAVLCLATAGSLVFSGSADMGICVWRRAGPEGEHVCLSVLTGHMGPVKCLAIERDREAGAGEGRWIVYSGSLDKSVKMWRASEQVSSPRTTIGQGGGSGTQQTMIRKSMSTAPSFASFGRSSNMGSKRC